MRRNFSLMPLPEHCWMELKPGTRGNRVAEGEINTAGHTVPDMKAKAIRNVSVGSF